MRLQCLKVRLSIVHPLGIPGSSANCSASIAHPVYAVGRWQLVGGGRGGGRRGERGKASCRDGRLQAESKPVTFLCAVECLQSAACN